MSEKISVNQALDKAKLHVKNGEIIEAQKFYQAIFNTYSKQAKDIQKKTADLNFLKQNNSTKNPPEEIINSLEKLYNNGDFFAVIEKTKALLLEYPHTIVLWNALGASSTHVGMIDQAVIALNKVLILNPNHFEALSNLGVALLKQGKLEEAIDAYNKAILIKPDYAMAYSNLGNALKDIGKHNEAIDAYNKALSIDPNYADPFYNMGNALKDQGKLKEAIQAYKNFILLNPNLPIVYNNMGNALKDQGKIREAIDAYNKALSLDPNCTIAHNNKGIDLKDMGKTEESIQSYKKALSIEPDYAETHLNLSFMLLNSGKLEEGLDEYEWRWKTKEGLSRQRFFSKPLWNGETSLKDKKILLWSEQGIGDTINWSSKLPYIAKKAKHCILECQDKLVPLLQRSFPDIEVIPENRILDSERDDFDFHLPMGSLYRHFIKEISNNDKTSPYLIADPSRVKFWKKQLKSIGSGPYVGISWKSSDMSSSRIQNYAPISEWSPILKIPNVTFINLQYKDFIDDINNIREEFGVEVHNFDDLDHYNDIDDVAALCTALDIIVSTKITVPLISTGVGTPTKLANWKQSTWNNKLLNPVGSCVDIFERNTWETWNNIFNSIAGDITNLNNRSIK